MSYQLSITALKPQEVPPEDTLIALAKELVESTTTWKKGKTFAKGNVLTLSRPKGPDDEAPWHCQVSEHTKEDATFDEFWGKLGVSKAENEKEFISAIKKVAQVKRISRLFTWSSPPQGRGESPPTPSDVFQWCKHRIIVSIPIDLCADEELAKIEEKGVKGKYVAVER